MKKRQLKRIVPFRASHLDRVTLRRWAREEGSNVSKIVRDLIAERRRSEMSGSLDDAITGSVIGSVAGSASETTETRETRERDLSPGETSMTSAETAREGRAA